MSHQDHNKEFEKSVNKAWKEVSSETTSNKLDQSILAMAEAQHEVKLGFWDRLFRSKQMKYAVSMSAALVMTVGIARFMVYLGKTDQGLAQNSDILVASESVSHEVIADDYAFELVDETPSSQSRYQAKKAEAMEAPELVTNDEMREILAETERLATNEAKKELLEEEQNLVVGSRVKRVDTESPASIAMSKPATEKTSKHIAGVMDEAIEDTPKPEAWLAEVEALLKQDKLEEAREEWSQFKNTYPEYFISEALSSKLKSMGL